MPQYTSVCGKCGKVFDYTQTVANRHDTPKCHRKATEKVIDAPMVGAMSFTGHKSFPMLDGKTYIEDGATYKQYMRQNNKVSGAEAAQEADRVQANRTKDDKQKLAVAVETAIRKHTN